MNRIFTPFVFAFLVSLSLFTSCKKNSDAAVTSSVDPATQIQQGSDGILYALVINRIANVPGVDADTLISNSATAWFGNYTKTVDAGNVSCNVVPMYYTYFDSTFGQQINTAWYANKTNVFGTGPSLNFTTKNNIVSWKVSGNTSNSITGFNTADSLSWPTISNFSVPETVSATAGITLNYKYDKYGVDGSAYDYIARTISGQKGNVTDTISVTGNSFKVSGSDIAKCAAVGDVVSIQLMGAKFSKPYVVGSKTYRFAKEAVYSYTVEVSQ